MDSLRQKFPEIKEIHSSLQATIFEAIDQHTREPVIIKISAQPSDDFRNEISVYNYIQKEEYTKCSPKFLWTEVFEDGTEAFALEALGPNIEMIYEIMNRRMPLATLLKLGDLMINCVKELHMRGVLHCDIRPENFLIGRGKNSNDLYLIGFSKSKIVGEYLARDLPKCLTRRASFQSLSSQMGLSSGYRDDLESIGLVLVYFHEGQLPWQGILVEDDETRFDLIASIKSKTRPEELYKNLPQNFATFFNMCWELKENEIPDYNKFCLVFRQLLMLDNFQKGGSLFDWPLTEQNGDSKLHALLNDDDEAQFEGSNRAFRFGIFDDRNTIDALARTKSQILAEGILDSSDDDLEYFKNN